MEDSSEKIWLAIQIYPTGHFGSNSNQAVLEISTGEMVEIPTLDKISIIFYYHKNIKLGPGFLHVKKRKLRVTRKTCNPHTRMYGFTRIYA